MTYIRGTLFVQGKDPLVVEMQLDPKMTLDEQGPKIVITAGDDVCSGSTSLPLAGLVGVIAQLQQQDAKRSQPGIIMPDNSIIRPN